jgi:hypothetical protein
VARRSPQQRCQTLHASSTASFCEAPFGASILRFWVSYRDAPERHLCHTVGRFDRPLGASPSDFGFQLIYSRRPTVPYRS